MSIFFLRTTLATLSHLARRLILRFGKPKHRAPRSVGVVQVFSFFLLFSLFFSLVYAQSDPRFDETFVTKLQANHINITDLQTKSTISRYELTRILNLVECRDCLDPGQKMRDTYTPSFWSEFIKLPGKDFRDIIFEEAFGTGTKTSYYYCVAYVGDNQYMRGYPVATSPICRGDFCGDKAVTKAEFIQVIINIVEKYMYKNYKANRSDIKKRSDSLFADEYAARTLTDEDRTTIAIASKSCKGTSCPLTSRYEFESYLKYCMFHLDACQFKPFGWVKQNYWPVAELNIMSHEGLIPIGDNPELEIHQPVDGTYVLKVIGELHKKINCSFDPDYDCDGLKNWEDNCKNTYNPQQRDIDHDNIGNVCDDDIDNGGQKHPKGIVDDNDRIILNVLKTAPTAIEKDLVNREDDNIGNSLSVTSTATISLDIQAKNIHIGTTTDKTYIFIPSIQGLNGNPDKIDRSFGDGIQKETLTNGSISHTYTKPGTYVVNAMASKGTQKAVAKTTVIVPQKIQKAIPIAMTITPSVTTYPSILQGTVHSDQPINTGTVSRYRNGHLLGIGPTISISLTGADLIALTAKVTDAQNNLQSITQSTIETALSFSRSSQIQSTYLTPNINEDIIITTIAGGRSTQDIAGIERYLGDTTPTNNKSLTMKTSFKTPGTKVIMQTITFLDGTKHVNYLTLTVPAEATTTDTIISFTSTQKTSRTQTNIPFVLSLTNINPDDIIKTIIDRSDGQTETIDSEQITNNNGKLSHTYIQGGKKNPLLTIHLKNCRTLYAQLTIHIIDPKDCRAAYDAGILEQTYHCDMDADEIPDMCDDDIDGDGKQNPLGIILFENSDCSLQANNYIVYPTKIQETGNILGENTLIGRQGNGIATGQESFDTLPVPATVPVNNNILTSSNPPIGPITNNNLDTNLLAQAIRIDACTLDVCPFTPDNNISIITPSNTITTNNTTSIGATTTLATRQNIPPTYSSLQATKIVAKPLDLDGDGVCDICPEFAKILSPSQNSPSTQPGSIQPTVTSQVCIDIDKDGICNTQDACQLLPETFNGKDDNDGCPELGPDDPCFTQPSIPEATIAATNCNTCPCHFADLGGQLLRSDTLRAVLMNTGGTVQYSRSFPQKRTK